MIIERFVELPYAVKGFTIRDENEDYNIYINLRHLSQQKEILKHELSHINNGDFDRPVDAAVIERMMIHRK